MGIGEGIQLNWVQIPGAACINYMILANFLKLSKPTGLLWRWSVIKYMEVLGARHMEIGYWLLPALLFQVASHLPPLTHFAVLFESSFQRLILILLISDSRRMLFCGPEKPNMGPSAQLTAGYQLCWDMEEIGSQRQPMSEQVDICVQHLHWFEPA